MSTPESSTQAQPRAIAPDLARGLMLLLIALANVPWYLYNRPVSGTTPHSVDAEGLNALWQGIAIVAIDSRSYPLFAFLFGYGMWQLYQRQQERGLSDKQARRLMQWRHFWMVMFGAVHAALLFFGDIIGAYGLVGLVVTWLFLRRAQVTLRVWSIVLASLLALMAVMSWIGGSFVPGASYAFVSPAAMESWVGSIIPRLSMWAMATTGMAVFGLAVPLAVLIAIQVARHRVLENPSQHRRLLWTTAAVGIPIGWIGAIPSLLVHFQVWEVARFSSSMWHALVGLACGLGYAALFALIAERVSRRRVGAVSGALVAVGKRSMTCYLLQSVIFAPLLSAWGFGLGGTIEEWQAALVAAATWLVTVAVAVLSERAGKRGPAEWALRTVAYRGNLSGASPVARSGVAA